MDASSAAALVLLCVILLAAAAVALVLTLGGTPRAQEEAEAGGGPPPPQPPVPPVPPLPAPAPAQAPTRAGRRWASIRANRFGDYRIYGEGAGHARTVACTDSFPRGAPGAWTAMNYGAFGLDGLPCGMRLRVSDPSSGRSAEVVVMDGGGSEGLDLSDSAYRSLFGADRDGLVSGMDVEELVS